MLSTGVVADPGVSALPFRGVYGLALDAAACGGVVPSAAAWVAWSRSGDAKSTSMMLIGDPTCSKLDVPDRTGWMLVCRQGRGVTHALMGMLQVEDGASTEMDVCGGNKGQ